MIAKSSKSYQFAADLLKRLNQLDWIPILLVRLSVGLLFFESGRGKLFVKFDELVKYFGELGIPLPYLNALVTASIEFVGGICLIIGFATRIFSAPLAFIMLVAILTAQLETVHTLGDFLFLPEVLLLTIFIWLVFSGPGKVSLDHLLARRLGLGN
ncbi:MAG: DoxX family protein [Candidatus Binatia bacterium]